ncbi:MAG: biopolymer transporter ExbD [Bacteroidales bacterium]|nr:biopolymer transporter ExbD [Bacteroidales bacterium]
MAKFRKKGGQKVAALSTASLPDIVFMLLFFFMSVTSMKETDYKVKIKLPTATEVKKLEKKSLVSYIYVGAPLSSYQGKYGTEPRIQLNDKICELWDIADYVESERQSHDEAEVPLMTYSLKVDSDAKMGIVTDIKQNLREVQALKINYSTLKTERKGNY